ncbi:MAG: hypothetical protein M4579_002350 [Chaenotheca gracillima]|nr:MAG: hypothetical protein M4579_002350 [Chaenotheca gracillima]
MQEVLRVGSLVWDPHSRPGSESHLSQPEDSLPPFPTLMTDEDRERKAESYDPGTYHVIVNPESFAGLPEYSEDDPASEFGSGDTEVSHSFHESASSSSPSVELTGDSNVVILRKFEDPSRRPSAYVQTRSASRSPVPVQSSRANVSPLRSRSTLEEVFTGINALEEAPQISADWRLASYYRSFVSRRVIGVHQSGMTSVSHEDQTQQGDAYEAVASSFRPLSYAMSAVSALSLAFREKTQNIDALQYYQHALPSLQRNLRSSQDMSSDGALFTHFFLLLYEIAASEQWGSNLWLQHLNHLLRIILVRRDTFRREDHFLLIWFVCIIDLYGLLSGGSEGEFVATIIRNDLLPLSQHHLSLGSPQALGAFLPEEEDSFAPVLYFNQQIVMSAVRLGQMSRAFRQGCDQQRYEQDAGGPPMNIDLHGRQREVLALQEHFRSVFRDSIPRFLGSDWLAGSHRLPSRVQAILQHAFALYHSCMIYSHTSLWPSQRDDIDTGGDGEMTHSVREILALTGHLVQTGHLELRFIVFPLFMAGFAAASGEEKVLALELITALEQESLGPNTARIRHLLQLVYERQHACLVSLGHARSVDWISIMVEQGLQVVNFGL